MTLTSVVGDRSFAEFSSFPRGFAWGVATAAYQIEGAANEGGRGPSIWDTFSRTPGRTLHGDTGDIACDHYHRWESDLDLLASLGVTAYRLSFSWSRLQPEGRGPLNETAVAFYRKVLSGLRQRNIEAFVTLYHWDLPQPLEDEGGWPCRETAYRFADYVREVVAALGDSANRWITINEPWCSSFLGYGSGAHAPGRRDMGAAVAAAHHLNLAHGLAVGQIRSVLPKANIGISNLITDIVPGSDSVEDAAAVMRLDAVSNRVFLDPLFLGSYSPAVHSQLAPYGLDAVVQDGDLQLISARLDFMGVNHYQRIVASDDATALPFRVQERPAEPATTSFGWSVVPESLTRVLARVAREYTAIPLYVTESGASYDDCVDSNGEVVDSERIAYLSWYMNAAGRAIAQGVDLRGYFVWSFLDNFEWAEGYSKRFGLVFVDYSTQERILKHSAVWYRDLIDEHRRHVGTEGDPEAIVTAL